MKIDLKSYRLFLIDMDDTLYEERHFVLSGFKAVAEHVTSLGIEPKKAFDYLQSRFDSVGRDHIFNYLLTAHTGSADADCVKELIKVYRNHTPQISLYPRASDVLVKLRQLGKIIVVTDGLPAVQKRKYQALELDTRSDQLICCWELNAPKPNPGSLEGIVKPGQKDALYIGDDPVRDLPLAAAVKIDAIRVRTGRFRDLDNPYPPLTELEAFHHLI